MKQDRFSLYLILFSLLAILVGAALYANWDSFKTMSNETMQFLASLIKIVGVILVVSLGATVGIYIWKLWQGRNVQVIRPGKFGEAQAILDKKNGVMYLLPERSGRKRQQQLPEPHVIPGSIITPIDGADNQEALPAAGQSSAPAPLQLPGYVRYEEIAQRVPTGHALIGISAKGIETRKRGIKALIWIVGGSGTGKTNTVSLRVDEDYTWGHRFLVIDPHWFKEDSLWNAIAGYSDRFLWPTPLAPGQKPVAYEPEDILAVLNCFLTEFNRRKKAGAWNFPITLIIDEVGSLVSDSPENKLEEEIIAKIKQIARICGQESRGFEMGGMYISQDAAGLAWLRKRAILVLAHQLLAMSERKLACNDNMEIARSMDDWPIGRTLAYGIGLKDPRSAQ